MKTNLGLKTGVAAFALSAGLCAAPAFAQDADTAAAAPDDSQTIIVTGSITRNPAAATASPVVSLSQDDLDKRGITTTTEALQSLTANNAGTVPPSWSAFGFTTGASTPSLRGFNDAYTLVLFDGMRTAYYPLADDTQRTIVDINTIPSGIVDRIDTLLDGASATYGSDAIAGVVNVIAKPTIVGLHLNGSAGISQRGDAGEQRLQASYGYGDLDTDGFNVYAAGEYSHGSPLYLRARGAPFSTSDQSSICGNADQGCLFNGIVNGIQYDGSYTGFGSTTVPYVRPYSDTATPLGAYQMLNPAAGCAGLTAHQLTPAEIASAPASQQAVIPTNGIVCQQDLANQYYMYNASIERLGGTLRATARLGADAQAYAMFNYYRAKTHNTTTPYGYTGATAAGGQTVTVSQIFLPTYVCPNGVGSVTGGVLTASGCDATNGTLNPNNPFAAQGNLARLVGRPNVARSTDSDAQTYRLSGGITGSAAGFNYNLGATWSRVNLDLTNNGYIYLQGLLDAVAQGTYNFADPSQNSQAAIDQVFPTNEKRATSKLFQVMASVNRDVFQLPGGMANIAVAGQYRHEAINNPSANPPNNDDPYARYYSINAVGVQGARNVWSASYEVALPILDMLRLKADGSYDHYSTGQKAFSPKFEAEFKPIQQLKLRGTYSKGFRAPNFSESFNLPATGYTTQQINCTSPIYAAFCAAHASNPAYYSGGYSLGLTSSGNPDLKPEKSTSYTFGAVLQPMRNVTLTLDYWHTKIKHVIVPASASTDLFTQYYQNNGTVNIPGVTVTPGVADQQNPNALPLLGFISSSFKNANQLLGSGIDGSIDAKFPIGESMTWTTKLNGSYLIRLQQTNEDGSVYRYDGSLGGCGVTSCSGAPRFRATWQNTIEFRSGPSLTLTANYTSGYSSVATDSGGVYGDCAASAANGQLVVYDNGDPVQCHSKATFDLDGHLEVPVADKFKFYMDVLNILDSKPTYDPNAGYGIYQFNPAWQDRLFIGRYFRVGAKVDF